MRYLHRALLCCVLSPGIAFGQSACPCTHTTEAAATAAKLPVAGLVLGRAESGSDRIHVQIEPGRCRVMAHQQTSAAFENAPQSLAVLCDELEFFEAEGERQYRFGGDVLVSGGEFRARGDRFEWDGDESFVLQSTGDAPATLWRESPELRISAERITFTRDLDRLLLDHVQILAPCESAVAPAATPPPPAPPEFELSD